MSTRSLRPDELVELAAVVRAHGLRGELLLKPFNPDSELWTTLERVALKSPEGVITEHEVERGHIHGTGVILGLVDVRDRNVAEGLKGSLVCVPRETLPAPDEDEHYLIDLVGLEVRDEQAQPVGRVVDVIEYPSVACLVVEHDDSQVEVPNLDRYVLAIDTDARIVTVSHLDELEVLRSTQGKGSA